MKSIAELNQDLIWRDVPSRAVALAEKCAGTVKDVREAIKDLDQDGFLDIWYNEDLDRLLLNVGDWMETENCRKWTATLEPLADSVQTEAEIGGPSVGGEGTWVKIAFRPHAARAFLEKRAVSPTLNFISKNLGYQKGPIPGSPSPLIAGLTTGLLGAGLGYGAGWLGEKVLPEKWKRGNLRRTLSIMGGLAGLVPAMAWIGSNVERGRPWYSGQAGAPPAFDYTNAPQALLSQEGLNPYPDNAGGPGYIGRKYFPKTGMEKEAQWPMIDVPQFNNAIWQERGLSPATRAAASGLITGASAMRGGARFISPMDVARITAGMGSGWLSGAIIGKTLGILTGMPSATQERIRNAGLYAGIVTNLIPLAFGR